MRILFASAQLSGHLDWGGYLKTAQALQQNGHEILWASGAQVRSILSAAEIPFVPLHETGWRWPPPPSLTIAPDQTKQEFQRQRQIRSLDQWLDTSRVLKSVHRLNEIVADFQPDLIGTEMFVAAAPLVAEQQSIPLFVAGWPAPADISEADQAKRQRHPLEALSRIRLEQLLEATGCRGTNWIGNGPTAIRSPLLHISYFSPSWYGESARHGQQTRYVGGLPNPIANEANRPPWLPDPEDAPWVLITLGTTFNQDPSFFAAAARATLRLGCHPILVCGPNADLKSILERIPQEQHRQVSLRDYVNFNEILPWTVATIHHGGAGTTHAMIVHGIPQIVVPHAGDQMRQGQGVAKTGTGFHIAPQQATIDNLAAGLAQVLPELSKFRLRAGALATEFAALGGPGTAAQLVESLHSP